MMSAASEFQCQSDAREVADDGGQSSRTSSMRMRLQSAMMLMALFAIPLGFAQGPNPAASASISHMSSSVPAEALNLDEGLAVLGAAMESRHHPPQRRDCSHFVHTIYERAGFPYSYENSIAMYDGTSEFERVTRPQPGDLIVWRGHMGVIVNPVQHSFFSSLRTGLGVERYDSPYWKKRGRPRFFRYVKSAPAALTLASARSSANEADNDNDEDASSVEPSQPEALPALSSSTPSVLSPLTIAGRPSNSNVQQVLEEGLKASAELPPAEILNSSKAVIIFDSFKVKKVHLKKDQGWAEVQMNEPSSLVAGQANLQRRSDRQHWILIRTGKNKWELARPADTIYLPKDAAVRILAHELAAITADRSTLRQNTPHEAELARLLDNLLGE